MTHSRYIKEFYKNIDREGKQSNTGVVSNTETIFDDVVLSKIIGLIKQNSIQNVIDIGGNNGSYLKKLIDLHSNLIGTCFDLNCLNTYSDINYVNGDATELSAYFSEESFDLALLLDVIEHIPETDRVIDGISHILKRSGFLVIITPNLSSLVNRLSLLVGMLPPPMEVSYLRSNFGRPNLGGAPVGHLRIFTFKAIVEFVKFHRFQIIESFTLPSFYFFTAKWEIEIRKRILVALFNFIEKITYKLSNHLSSRTVIICKRMEK